MVRPSAALPVLHRRRRLQDLVRPIQPQLQQGAVHPPRRLARLRGLAHILDVHNRPSSHDTGIFIRHDRNGQAVTSVPHTSRRRNVRSENKHEDAMSSVEHNGGAGADKLFVY